MRPTFWHLPPFLLGASTPECTRHFWISIDLANRLAKIKNMKRVTIHEAKTTLSKLLLLVTSGTSVEIARGGVPVARLVPIDLGSKKRIPGKYKGQIKISDDFDSPLPEKMMKHFK